jgi:hypothetical protein
MLLVALLLGLARVFGNAPTASAAPPETTTTEILEVNAPVSNCGSFTIIANYTGILKTTVYFNAQGDPIRLLFQGRASGSLTNSVTGYSVKDAPSIRNGFVDLVKGTETDVGVDFHITAIGEGVVVLQAGRIVFEGAPPPTFVAGPHLGPPAESEAILCAALNH